MTYGEKTLQALYRHVLEARDKGVNLAEKNLDSMVKAYGYPSVKALEEERTKKARS